MSNKDIKKLKKFSNKYVAFVGKYLNIIASGETMRDVELKLKKKKINNATISFIPPVDKSFSPIYL